VVVFTELGKVGNRVLNLRCLSDVVVERLGFRGDPFGNLQQTNEI
jgi:hypothetical protein